MTTTDPKVESTEESAAAEMPEPDTQLLFGAGQSAWLALISLGVLLALAVSFVALFLAIDANDDEGGAAPAPSGPATSLAVEAKEFSFDPSRATIAADTDVEVSLGNVGAVEHNWTVLSESIGSEADFDESLVLAAISAQAGETGDGTVNLPAGSYQVICTIAGHLSAGMEGTLEVAA